ncbi:MAG TPA: HAMP domain-containing sensor histidine kinase [Bacteroidales bacterium]|nr:HAMP domain-containing sensor histidine kinase [Bacteroidales bacterium]
MNDLKTHYASAERDDKEVTLEQKAKIEASPFLDTIMAGTPFIFFILNDKRQVVYSNEEAIRSLGFDDLNLLVGLRPGEALSCINSNVEPAGCGTSENCRYCGAVRAIIESKQKSDLVIMEAIINTIQDGQLVPMNFEVSSKPFYWQDDLFYVLTLQNIAEKKRKEQLERVFFHDIINKAGNVSMFLELLESQGISNGDEQMFGMVKQTVEEMLEDIQYQTKLQKAERGELTAESEPLVVNDIIDSVALEYKSFAEAFKVKFKYDKINDDQVFRSDKVLIKRILGNLVKNAVEASKKGDKVVLYCEESDEELSFHVKNPAVIPKDVQKQIFNRSFSTKGEGRGIGTYSIKLFTEEYLKGRISFVSEKGTGTIFTVSFPWYI